MVKKKIEPQETSTMIVATNVSQTVGGFKKKSAPLFRIVENFTIKSKADQEKLVAALKQIKAYGKEAREQQAAFINPAKQIAEQAKSFFKPFLDSVDEADKLGKEKILAFVSGRIEASKAVGEKFKAGKSKLSTVVSKQAELEDNDNTRKLWKLKITRAGLIPRKYLVPDEAAIREALKKGKKVPGCLMVQETTISV